MPVGDKGELGQEMKCLRSLLVSTITASMLVAGPGFAADIKSANIMMPHCHDALSDGVGDRFAAGMCLGMIVGIEYLRKGGSCAPEGITQGQMLRVVVQYIDARPARLHEDFKLLALEALNAAWPCKR
jgi:Rap1a immunity proteins